MAEAQPPARINRTDLYDRVWSEPMVTLGPKLGLSDVGLRKICHRHGIPTPGRGYWQRVRHGKRVRRTPLRAAKDGQPEEIQLHRERRQAPPRHQEVGPVAEAREFESKPQNRIRVPEQLRNPHPLIKHTKEEWKARAQGSWDRRRRPVLNIDVFPDSSNRAYRIMHALLKALDKRDLPVRLTEGTRRKGGETVVTVNGEDIAFRLRELQRQVERKSEDSLLSRYRERDRKEYELVPSGRLMLEITTWGAHGGRRTWKDGKRQKLEDCLNDFIVGLVAASERIKAARKKREEWLREFEEEQRRRREAERLRQLEGERLTELKRQAAAWRQAREIREYLVAMRAAVESGAGPEGPELTSEEWLEWAESQVKRLDPLT